MKVVYFPNCRFVNGDFPPIEFTSFGGNIIASSSPIITKTKFFIPGSNTCYPVCKTVTLTYYFYHTFADTSRIEEADNIGPC